MLSTDIHLYGIYKDILQQIKDTIKCENLSVINRGDLKVDIKTNLIYQISDIGHKRLCILLKLHHTILKTIYDVQTYQRVDHMIEHLRHNIYIPKVHRII